MGAEFWSVDGATAAAILAMAAATYGVRAGGYWLIQRVRPTPFVEAWLRNIPGAMFVALVAPAIVAGGPAYWVGAAAVVAARVATGNLLAALAAGAAAAALVRALA
jgi:uncharacterized membrane protein